MCNAPEPSLIAEEATNATDEGEMTNEARARPKTLRMQPTKVKTTSIDSRGMLIFEDDLLIAVLVQLEESVHGERYGGKWNLEATFDELPYPPDKVFNSLDHAERWLLEQLERAQRDTI